MVAETETKISGWSAASRATTVPLPTAVGPERTVSRATDTSSLDSRPGDGGPDARAENSATRAAVWCLPSPRSRRLAAMSRRSITLAARTAPTRGSALSTSITLVWAITSSCSASASTSARVRSPDRRACLISARRRRAWVAAFLRLLTLLVAQRGNCHWSRPSLPIRGLRTYPTPRTAFISPRIRCGDGPQRSADPDRRPSPPGWSWAAPGSVAGPNTSARSAGRPALGTETGRQDRAVEPGEVDAGPPDGRADHHDRPSPARPPGCAAPPRRRSPGPTDTAVGDPGVLKLRPSGLLVSAST